MLTIYSKLAWIDTSVISYKTETSTLCLHMEFVCLAISFPLKCLFKVIYILLKNTTYYRMTSFFQQSNQRIMFWHNPVKSPSPEKKAAKPQSRNAICSLLQHSEHCVRRQYLLQTNISIYASSIRISELLPISTYSRIPYMQLGGSSSKD